MFLHTGTKICDERRFPQKMQRHLTFYRQGFFAVHQALMPSSDSLALAVHRLESSLNNSKLKGKNCSFFRLLATTVERQLGQIDARRLSNEKG